MVDKGIADRTLRDLEKACETINTLKNDLGEANEKVNSLQDQVETLRELREFDRRDISTVREAAAELRDESISVRNDLLSAREAAQWYFDAFMGTVDELEFLTKLSQHSRRLAIWEHAERYPFLDTSLARG